MTTHGCRAICATTSAWIADPAATPINANAPVRIGFGTPAGRRAVSARPAPAITPASRYGDGAPTSTRSIAATQNPAATRSHGPYRVAIAAGQRAVTIGLPVKSRDADGVLG